MKVPPFTAHQWFDLFGLPPLGLRRPGRVWVQASNSSATETEHQPFLKQQSEHITEFLHIRTPLKQKTLDDASFSPGVEVSRQGKADGGR